MVQPSLSDSISLWGGKRNTFYSYTDVDKNSIKDL